MDDFKLIKNSKQWIVIDDIERDGKKHFNFDFYPNRWYTKIHKQYIEDMLNLKTIKIATLHRYHYNLKHFYKFLEEEEIELPDFSFLTFEITQRFLFYLKQCDLSNSTKNICMTALKGIINYGREFEFPGFPEREVFDGKEYKSMKSTDEYTTEYIPDDVMNKVEDALLTEEDVLFKSLLIILIDTGLRIDEALLLEEGCITLDFVNKPVMTVYSPKTDKERTIPVSQRVMYAIDSLEDETKEVRLKLKTKKLFVYKKRKYMFLKQRDARRSLKRFSVSKEIVDVNNIPYNLNFHQFRHRLGTDMINNGMTIFEVRDYLGHDSLRSTEHYAKVQNPTVLKEYKNMGFVGLVADDVKDGIKSKKINSMNEKNKQAILKRAALPDGACGLPLNDEVNFCMKFNMCILCPKFVTTPNYLHIHKSHLKRLRKDRLKYMADEQVGTLHHLMKMENALETIIAELEMMSNGSKKD